MQFHDSESKCDLNVFPTNIVFNACFFAYLCLDIIYLAECRYLWNMVVNYNPRYAITVRTNLNASQQKENLKNHFWHV